jgi:capsular polysaccharide biosynthesis protein
MGGEMEEQLNSTNYETTLRDYLRVIFRQKAVIITAFITVMVTVTIGLMLKTPVYESQVKMLISGQKQVESSYYRDLMRDGSFRSDVTLTQSEIVKSNPVIERAVKALELDKRPLDYEKRFCSPLKAKLVEMQVKMINAKLEGLKDEEKQASLYRLALEGLKKSIKVEPVRDTNLFTITARDFSPSGAAIIANVVSRSYIIFDLEQQLVELQLKYGEKHLAVMQLRDSIEKMAKGLSGEPLPNIEAIGPASVKIIEQSQIPLKPSGIPKKITLLLAFFMASFLGIMLAFTFEYLDQTFKSPQDIESYLNIPFLGSVPSRPKSKSYDLLAEQVLFLAKDRNLKTLVFTAPEAGADTGNIVVNIGRALAQMGHHKVLVIDANFGQLAFKKFLNLPTGPGLVDVIEEKVTFEKSVQSIDKNLAVLSSGESRLNPITVVNSGRMNEFLSEVAQKYDLVIISAPDLTHRDSIMLSLHADGVVLTVDEGKTRKQSAKAATTQLIEKKANILGVILNNRSFVIPKAIYNRV